MAKPRDVQDPVAPPQCQAITARVWTGCGLREPGCKLMATLLHPGLLEEQQRKGKTGMRACLES